MATVYVVSDGGRLVRTGQVLQLKLGTAVARTIFPFRTEQIVLIGNIEITSPALRFLMRHQVDTVFLSKRGRYNGKLVFQMSKNVFLRQRQFRMLDDHDFRLRFSRDVVRGKLTNQLKFIQRLSREQPGLRNHDLMTRMKRTLAQVDAANDLNQLRGYEGLGARYFFSVFGQAFKPDWVQFRGRNMHPPKDKANAVLSFIYTLILHRVDAVLEAQGLDPYVGYFHELDYGKRTLTFDLMEEYRTPLADTLTVALFNLGTLTAKDFRDDVCDDHEDDLETDAEELDPRPNREARAVLLTKNGLRKVITQFERKLDTAMFMPQHDRKMSYRQLFDAQARQFRRVLMGEQDHYVPLSSK